EDSVVVSGRDAVGHVLQPAFNLFGIALDEPVEQEVAQDERPGDARDGEVLPLARAPPRGQEDDADRGEHEVNGQVAFDEPGGHDNLPCLWLTPRSRRTASAAAGRTAAGRR